MTAFTLQLLFKFFATMLIKSRGHCQMWGTVSAGIDVHLFPCLRQSKRLISGMCENDFFTLRKDGKISRMKMRMRIFSSRSPFSLVNCNTSRFPQFSKVYYCIFPNGRSFWLQDDPALRNVSAQKSSFMY